MQSDFEVYLFYIIILAIVIPLVFFILFMRAKKRVIVGQRTESITGGSISIFFDRDKNAVIIPYTRNKYGVGKAIGEVIFVKAPYSLEKLGSSVRSGMKLCSSNLSSSNAELMSKLGYISWKDFSEGRKSISVYFHKEKGIVFNTTRRKADGVYEFNYLGCEAAVRCDVIDRELGEIIMELLKKCI